MDTPEHSGSWIIPARDVSVGLEVLSPHTGIWCLVEKIEIEDGLAIIDIRDSLGREGAMTLGAERPMTVRRKKATRK